MPYDALVVGAGFAGSVSARCLADAGRRVLLLERRAHIGGNAYDCPDEHGILIHRYGPHIFHTADGSVFRFLSRFTEWSGYTHRVVASVPGQEETRLEFPVPFNLVSLEKIFGAKAAELESKLIDTYGAERKATVLELRTSEDPEIAALAEYVYSHVFLEYTKKQWGQTPDKIDPATVARVPMFLSRDCRYFQDPYQGMPADGYTALFTAMLDHPNIEIHLNTEASSRLTLASGQILLDGVMFDAPVIYTGAADELFDRKFGPLPYRTLDFRFETHPVEQFQSHATVNYTVDQPFTRITEFKQLTGQTAPCTTIVKEFSRAYTGAPSDTPYYPVINPGSLALYQQYSTLAAEYKNLHLLGRLAEYKYYNMDAIAANALALAVQLLK